MNTKEVFCPTPEDAAMVAKERLGKVLGKRFNSFPSIEKQGTGWLVEVEVFEKDTLPYAFGIYEVSIDRNGEMTGWRRKEMR